MSSYVERGKKWVHNVRHLKKKDIVNFWVNDGPAALFLFIWFLLNLFVFFERIIWYTCFETDPFDVLGFGLLAARGSAACIKLNCGIVLVAVLRNLLSYLRGTVVGSYIPVDHNITFHRYVAWWIMFMTIIHVNGHYTNYLTVQEYDDVDELKEKFLDFDGDTPPSAWALGWTTIPGITGHLALILMIFFYSTAVGSVRRPFFEAFWYAHHLFIPFYLLLCIHGAAMILEPPTFVCWIIAPIIAYFIERIERWKRGHRDTILKVAISHPSRVIELQLKKSKFKFKAGQYLFLNCPYIAQHEWHPFTLSSAPEEPCIGVHIRVVGDWTGKLEKLLNPDNKLGEIQNHLMTAPDGSPIFQVDGPYGAASEEIFNFETVMLIGTGIGITPFASILKTIRYRIESQLEGLNSGDINYTPIAKVYFYWIVREQTAFEWFFEILSVLEDNNINQFLEINLYLTSVRSSEDMQRLMTAEAEQMEELVAAGRDPITGLKSGTFYGRPDFDEIFLSKAEQHKNQDIGVFFCGPSSLAKSLKKHAVHFTKHTSTRFIFHKENF
eukprot:CAMPEP_0174263720 /NCGR_PEP_ID=MMETSP0439-20130205/19797_1 /TAXON_ID=0 /ORGANISM="Stereomyxa ramosa, Strain Chinc5" /LENGTH=552 /DNA_ID=CAMNT_0015349225 /DNA_START=18 /DNA_END=1676 /DNA_ORIENTATION=+